MRRLFPLLIIVAVAACGPSAKNDGDNNAVDGGGADADPTQLGNVTGTVWAPGNAPGLVPPGHEIPVDQALVYLSIAPPGPIPQQAYCEQCQNAPGGAVTTDHRGNFTITNVVADTYWLVIQKGQFRIEQQVIINPQNTIQMEAVQTTLPSIHDPTRGLWTPRIALASGVFDDLEDIMGKMAFGEVDSNGKFIGTSAAGFFDVYANGGSIDDVAVGTLPELVGDLSRMLQYHIIFIPCGGSLNSSTLQNENVLRNIRDYVAAGGKLYVTDWSGEWSDNVFPEQVQLYDGGFGGTDTPANAYDATTGTWNTSLFGDADGSPSYSSDDAEAQDVDLHAWLDGQTGPTADGGEGTYTASNFRITGNWNHIENLVTVQVGMDNEGLPIYDEPKSYIIGSDGMGVGKKPLTVTFEPAGCGRVLYSTYHTTDNTHTGLVPQERVLLYLVMEIGICKEGPIVE